MKLLKTNWLLALTALLAFVETHMAILQAKGIRPAGIPWKLHTIDNTSEGADGVKLADINSDGFIDIATGWEEGGLTRIYLNLGYNAVKQPWPMYEVGETLHVEDALFVDLDNDGKLDIVSCSEGSTKQIYVHWTEGQISHDLSGVHWRQDVLTRSAQLSQQWMFAIPMQIDEHSRANLVAGSKGENAQIGWFQNPTHGRDIDAFKWHPLSSVGWVMSIWPRDMDGDADLDIVLSDRYGDLRGCRWLENPGLSSDQIQPWKNHFIGARDGEVLSMSLGDLDQDGLEDAVVAMRDFRILFLKRLDETGLNWRTYEISADFNAGNTRAVVIADINNDKQLDLAFTTWNSDSKQGVLWMEYENNPTNKNWKPYQISGTKAGIKYDRIEMLDLDGDGDLDLITCEEHEINGGLGVIWYENPTL